MTFGFSANLIWNYFNKVETNKNQIEVFNLKINAFRRTTGKGGSNCIIFPFKGNQEVIKISYDNIKPYLNQNSNDYILVLDVRKGIWDYYKLENWDIINK
ncbi:hypothetical protein [Flavobacterium sp.]|uniref:hypothetical protein n=1 Tax=Flavobacterium sp. TaxID=239 RepID=UPI00286E5309|nr:hypothetical protein [Flavobacterium sp.]